jgi:hypothetical protein
MLGEVVLALLDEEVVTWVASSLFLQDAAASAIERVNGKSINRESILFIPFCMALWS